MASDRFERIYVGWTGVAYRPQLLDEPKAPKNYKDQAKIDEYVAKERMLLNDRAAKTPGASRIIDIHALDGEGDLVFEACIEKGDPVGEFVHFLHDRVRGFGEAADNIAELSGGRRDPPVAVLKAGLFLASILYRLWEEPASSAVVLSYQLLYPDSYRDMIFVDPYDVLTKYRGSSDEATLSLESVLKIFFPGRAFPRQADIVRCLCDRMVI